MVADAEYSLSNNSWEEALDLLNPRLNGSKPRPQLLALRAEAYYGLGSFRNAIDEYSLAIKRSRKNHQYLVGRAKAYLALEKYSSAINDLTKAIELTGENPKYYRIRAEAYYKNQQFNQAYDDINYYLSFYPSDSDASFLLAVIAIDEGRYVDAMFCLGKLIKTHPKDPKYYYYRGIAYMKSENYSVAEIDLNIAVDKGFNLSESTYYRGVTRLKLGRAEDACIDLKVAIKQGNFKAQELFYNYCKKNTPQVWK